MKRYDCKDGKMVEDANGEYVCVEDIQPVVDMMCTCCALVNKSIDRLPTE